MSILILGDEPPPTAEPRLQALHRYWSERRRGRRFPARADIDPIDIPALLAHISLVDVNPGAPRFVYRVVGTKIVELLRRELTGLPVGTGVKATELDAVLKRYRQVADDGVALFHRDRTQESANDYTGVERLMLPLGPADGRVDMILSIVVPLPKD